MKRSFLLPIYFKKQTRAKAVERDGAEVSKWREVL